MRKASFLEKFSAVPHIVWILLFVVAPLIFVAYFAFTDTYGKFTFDNITMLSSYAHIFLLSVCFALIATAICILIGYPLAFFISQLKPKTQKVLVVLLMLPMWISLLIRTYSLMAILDNGGLLNSMLEQIGLAKVKIVGTSGAVILGMVYDFLPYMVLPIYTTLSKLDKRYFEAAADLGCSGTKTLFKVAFPLSMLRLKGQRIIMFFIVFTMYFSGGTIPIYLNVKEFGMLDSMWSLIIPGLISTFNVIILKNFFSSLPYELVEAASIDGATDFQVLTRIFLPLSFSSLATLSLFYAVGKWNSFNDALYYITSRELQPLQLKLYNLIKGSQSVEVAVAEGSSNDLSTNVSESIQSATIIFATLPILIVYPFVQRYFVAGVTMGAVKG